MMGAGESMEWESRDLPLARILPPARLLPSLGYCVAFGQVTSRSPGFLLINLCRVFVKAGWDNLRKPHITLPRGRMC